MTPMMKIRTNHPVAHALPGKQRGAVLVIALIMLLLLTLVGIAGMRDTQLQEKMAGSAEDRALAFQSAESALREAEGLLKLDQCAGACAATGFYTTLNRPQRLDANNAAVSEAEFWSKHFSADHASADDWSDATKVKTYAGTAIPYVISQPRYVIEVLPDDYTTLPKLTNGGRVGGAGIGTVYDYLITARGTGRTSDAVVILQSVYRYGTP